MTWTELQNEQRDREDALGRALQALPPPRAPRSLAPRVMAAVAARQAAPVEGRTWFTWPVWAQLASALVFVALVAVSAMAWPSVEAALSRVGTPESVRVVSIFFRAVWQPLASWVLLGLTATVLFCATLGALLSRVALGGSSR